MGMVGKAWSSGALCVVQNSETLPTMLHPRTKLDCKSLAPSIALSAAPGVANIVTPSTRAVLTPSLQCRARMHGKTNTFHRDGLLHLQAQAASER